MLKRFQLWLYSHGFAWILILLASLLMRRRMSHNNGVVTSGTLRVVPDPRFPPHELFAPGTEFRCRLRHASSSDDDDTVVQVRSASLKLADSRVESPLDLEMNTGPISIFWSVRSFFQFVSARKMIDGLTYRPFYERFPQGLVAAKVGVRDNPSSFAELHYYTECAQLFIGRDGIKRYVKFRLIPFDDVPESGVIRFKDEKELWIEVPRPGETRSPDYLKKELTERLSRGPVKYRLQLQLHTPSPADNDEIFNCNVAWDEATHPFLDVAIATLDTLLPHDESSRMIYSLKHCPPSLGLIPATSIDDYNSVTYLRAHVSIVKHVRVFAYKLFGMPKPDPSVRQTPT